MRIQTVFGFFCFFALVDNYSWSWELNHFHWVKSDNDEFLCATSPPNKTLNAVASRGQCVASCFQGCSSGCDAVNYWNNAQLCQQFYYRPCSYAVQQDCVNFQVTIIEFCSFETKQWNNRFRRGYFSRPTLICKLLLTMHMSTTRFFIR